MVPMRLPFANGAAPTTAAQLRARIPQQTVGKGVEGCRQRHPGNEGQDCTGKHHSEGGL